MENSSFPALDATDKAILRTLQQNARLTVKEVAQRVHLSTTPVYERIKRLERSGIIRKYVAVVDADKLNQGFSVYCSIKLRRLNHDLAMEFTTAVTEMPEVVECYNISGSFDYLLRIQAQDMHSYQQFLLNTLGRLENIASIESTFIMEEIKHEYGVSV